MYRYREVLRLKIFLNEYFQGHFTVLECLGWTRFHLMNHFHLVSHFQVSNSRAQRMSRQENSTTSQVMAKGNSSVREESSRRASKRSEAAVKGVLKQNS